MNPPRAILLPLLIVLLILTALVPACSEGQTVRADLWQFTLKSVSWQGSELTVKLTVTNPISDHSLTFGCASAREIVAMYNNMRNETETNSPCGDFYNGKYDPQQSRTGTLIFKMPPNCGSTHLYMKYDPGGTSFYLYDLFDCGSPQ